MPPSASSKRPLTKARRAGERTALVTEELVFHEVLGERRTVHFDERPSAASASLVERAREELLANACLSFDQYGGVERSDLLDLPEDVAERVALAHDLIEVPRRRDLVLEVDDLLLQPTL